MTKRKIPFNKSSIEKLPEDKPAVYKIRTPSGATNYIGSAQKGQVKDRLRAHLRKGGEHVPGDSVIVDYLDSVRDARATEKRAIARTKPKYNKQGK